MMHLGKTVNRVVTVCDGNLANAVLRLGGRVRQRVVVGDMMGGLHTSVSDVDSTTDSLEHTSFA